MRRSQGQAVYEEPFAPVDVVAHVAEVVPAPFIVPAGLQLRSWQYEYVKRGLDIVGALCMLAAFLILGRLFSSNYPGANAPFWQYFGASLDHSVLALCFGAFALTNYDELWSIHSLRRRSMSRQSASR